MLPFHRLVNATVVAGLLLSITVGLSPSVFAASAADLVQAGQRAIDMENYTEAASLFNQAISAAQQGKDSAQELIARGGLGEALIGQGDFGSAAKQFKSVMGQAPKVLGDSLSMARIYDAYGWLMLTQNKPNDATSYCQMGLDMRKKVAPGSASVAESYESLGAINELQGLYDPAATDFLEAIKIRQPLGPEQYVMLSNLEERLAMIDVRRGKYPEAQQQFNEALQHKTATGAASQQFVPHTWMQTVMYRFANGSPYCGRTASGAQAIQTANGILVEASWEPSKDVGKAAQVKIRITNNSQGPIDVLPRPAIMVVLTPQVKIVSTLDSEQLARTVEKKGERKASMIRFFQGNADTTVTSTMYQSPGWQGGYRNAWGYYQPMYNNRSQTTTMTTFIPDWEARARAEAKAQDAIATAQRTAENIRSQAVVHCTLPPGETMEGALQFDATKVNNALLKIPIGNAVFEFPVGPGAGQ